MEPAEHLEALRSDTARAVSALERADLDVSIAACPDWNLGDLVWHLGAVHHFWTEIVDRHLQEREADSPAVRPRPAELLAWFEQTSARLVHVLERADPDLRVWTWSEQNDVRWVRRRMAQETAVHRWDVENALGDPARIGVELASDGIDEFVEFMVPDGPPVTDSITISTSDSRASWTLGSADGTEARISGAASDVLLVLWRRIPLDDVTISGDRDAAGRFIRRTDLE